MAHLNDHWPRIFPIFRQYLISLLFRIVVVVVVLNANYLLNFDEGESTNVITETFPKLTNWHPDTNENMYLSILIQSIKLMRWNIANP